MDSPEIINDDAEGTWLVNVKIRELDGVKDLMTKEEYDKYIEEN